MRLWSLSHSNIGKSRQLPLVRREIPVARTGFVTVAAFAVSDGGVAPVIHAHLQQGSARDADAGGYGATFQMTGRQGGARRGAPKMPDAVGVLADAENYGAVLL